ncbi:ABC transporter permease [Pacificispira sp.]|uniref:ABC transporter permease n=1 Tax=Pacificispira sp. TaxID=2888761 RepID=UPI003B51866D
MPAALKSFVDSELVYRLRSDWVASTALAVTVVMIAAAALAPFIAPMNPYDLASLDLSMSLLPPAWEEWGDASYPLGSDSQGRDLLSAILFGMRISILVGVLSIAVSVFVGVLVGLVAGAAGGWVDAILMRVADIQLALPAILVALLIDGAARATLSVDSQETLAIPVLVFAIALSGWVQYARAVRAATMVEMRRDYVASARLIGVRKLRLVLRHVLPNAVGSVFVLATVHLATAIVTEATLSFLGVGMPPTVPSLGTLIRNGYDFLFSGEWWIAIFPGLSLAVLVLAVNLLGDWLRDVLNPRLN